MRTLTLRLRGAGCSRQGPLRINGSPPSRERKRSLQHLDTATFLWLTASPRSASCVVALAMFMASAWVPMVMMGLVVSWVRARPGWRPTLLDVVAAGALGLGLVQVSGWLHYRPRPFESGLEPNLLGHLPENSFPRDHANLTFALAFAVLGTMPLRGVGTCHHRAGLGRLLSAGLPWSPLSV